MFLAYNPDLKKATTNPKRQFLIPKKLQKLN